MRYYPYGETRSGTLPTDYRYTGQRFEAGLGLYDYHARYYDPTLGRFISADTIVPNPGDPQSLNRYSYVQNNPLKYTDPSGNYSEDQIEVSFGVDQWEEVLKFFEEGGALEGKWGWLEILRRAEDGSELYQGIDRNLMNGAVATWKKIGDFASSGGAIYLWCLKNLPVSELLKLSPFAWERPVDQQIVGAGQGEFSGTGEASHIYRLGGEGGFVTAIGHQHNEIRVGPAINYGGLAADGVGLLTCPIGGKGVQQAIWYTSKIRTISRINAASSVASLAVSLQDGITPSDIVGWGFEAGSLVFSSNPAVGCPFALASVANNVLVYGP